MSLTKVPAAEDALRASLLRHPSRIPNPGCPQCSADGMGRFVPCATHGVEPLARTYVGTPGLGGGDVFVIEQVLTTGEVLATWTLSKRAADGGEFSWGYAGLGPRHLADAILSDALGVGQPVDAVLAFKDEVIADMPGDEGFGLSRVSVLSWIYDYRGHKGGSAVSQ